MEYMKGSEPFSFKGTKDKGVLLVQGFTSTPDSFRYIGGRFKDAGWHVECQRLPGHCTVWQDILKVTWQDWLAAEEDALAKLEARAKNVFVMGLSLGGLLALRLAQTHPEVKAASVINHMLFTGNPLEPFVPVLKFIVRSTPAIASDIKDPAEKEIAYSRTPTRGVGEILKLSKIVQKDHDKLVQPLIIFKSKDDHLLPAKNAAYTYERAAAKVKELVWLENSYHVATMDYDKDIIFEKSLAFFEKA